jgi:hypothetical protein
MILGRVGEVDGHYIATRFVTLVPVECLYFAFNRSSKPDATAKKKREGLRVRPHWLSVGIGCAQVWLPIVAVVLPTAQLLGPGRVPILTWLVSAALVVASSAVRRLGGLPEREKARLRLLGSVTGLRIDPSRLLPRTREVKRESLGQLMEKAGIPLDPRELVQLLDDIPTPALPLVHGYACYAGDDPEWRSCAELIFTRYEQLEV